MKPMIEHIPAHDRVTKLYTFDELDFEVRNRLIRECGERNYGNWDYEYRDTLKKLEELFEIICVDWQINDYRYNYSLRFKIEGSYFTMQEVTEAFPYEFDWLNLFGNRAMGKCWTMWQRDVVKGKYYSGKMRGTIGKDANFVHRHSKVLFDGLHDGTCPLTGFCADNDALDPLWDMMEGKFVKTSITIADMIYMCFDAFFRAWKHELEYVQTEEYFRENEMAEYYDEYGEIIDVPKDAIIKDVA
jgi:hypothetical protein